MTTREEFQLKEIARLAPTPKKSTTTAALIGGAAVAVKTDDLNRQRREIENIVNPPVPPVQQFWDRAEAKWKAQDQRRAEEEKQKQLEIKAREKANEEATQREAERQTRVKEFRTSEAMVELALSELSPNEKSSAFQQLAKENRLQDAERAGAIAQTLIANRTPNSTQSSGERVNWTSALRSKR